MAPGASHDGDGVDLHKEPGAQAGHDVDRDGRRRVRPVPHLLEGGHAFAERETRPHKRYGGRLRGWLPSTERSQLAEQPQHAKQTRAAARRAEVTGRAGQSARKEALEGVPAGATMRTCPSGCAS
ncbi:hypothetical protein [Streptosporangium canum]|uniref:hypothetical protein n=1 Tax=Streptosporangium canum TaxID=324952 RepID=UPI0037AFC0EE